MESKTTCFGGGFTTLTMRGRRLAYLQVIRDLPPCPGTDDGHELTLFFYQLDSADLWAEIIGQGDPYGALRLQARYGNLGLRKLLRSPLGDRRVRVFDIQHARWEILDDGATEVAGKLMPRRFKLFDVPTIGYF